MKKQSNLLHKQTNPKPTDVNQLPITCSATTKKETQENISHDITKTPPDSMETFHYNEQINDTSETQLTTEDNIETPEYNNTIPYTSKDTNLTQPHNLTTTQDDLPTQTPNVIRFTKTKQTPTTDQTPHSNANTPNTRSRSRISNLNRNRTPHVIRFTKKITNKQIKKINLHLKNPQ